MKVVMDKKKIVIEAEHDETLLVSEISDGKISIISEEAKV